MSTLDLQLLGPVELRVDGERADLRGAKPAGLLALLALSAGAPVSTDTLIDGLWDEAPPSAQKMLQMHVSAVRRALGDDHDRLRTTARGYVLSVAGDELDLTRVQRLRERAEQAGDPRETGRILREALALWSGPSLHGVRDLPFAGAAADRLDEMRTTLLSERIDADLAAGMHRELVHELRELVAMDPVHEQLCGQLMLALYRSGRQAEALEAARTLRMRLDEELGLAPGQEIAALEHAILNHAPELDLAPTPRPGGAAMAPPPPMTHAGGRRRRRRAAGALLVLATVGVPVMAALEHQAPSRMRITDGIDVRPHSLAIIDGATDRVAGDITLDAPADRLAVSLDDAYAASTLQRTLTVISLRRRRPPAVFGLPQAPEDLAAGPSGAWVSDGFEGTVSRYDAAARQLTAPFFPAQSRPGLVAITSDSRRLWAGLPDGRVVGLDAANLATVDSLRLADRVRVLAAADGEVCAGFFRRKAAACFRPDHGQRPVTVRLPAPPQRLAVDASGVWALAGAPLRLWHQRPGGSARVIMDLPGAATGLAVSPGFVWVLLSDGRLIRRSADEQGPVVTLDLGRRAAALAASGGRVYVSVA